MTERISYYPHKCIMDGVMMDPFNNSYVCPKCGYTESVDSVYNQHICMFLSILADSPLVGRRARKFVGELLGEVKAEGIHTQHDLVAKFARGFQEPIVEQGIDTNIILVWTVQDIKSIRPDLSINDCISILQNLKDRYDPADGITWDEVKRMASVMYPKDDSKDIVWKMIGVVRPDLSNPDRLTVLKHINERIEEEDCTPRLINKVVNDLWGR